jgi:hypothetical protein
MVDLDSRFEPAHQILNSGDRSTMKDLDNLYMQKQVDLGGLPAPRATGIDEISIRKGHNYRVIVSDLDRGAPFGSV